MQRNNPPGRAPLAINAFSQLVVLVGVMSAMLFVSAGTLHFWQAWVFLGNYLVSSLVMIIYLLRHDPSLLRRRLRGGPAAEKVPAQKIIMTVASLGFVGAIAVPALDHRFGWSHMPTSMALVGDGLILLGWIGVFQVFKVNTYTAATIELAPGQQVISTGPYAAVRHPMYAAGLLLLTGIPIALGSWWGVLAIVAILPALIWRLLNEENFLAQHLPGYRHYQTIVQDRLIPHIW